MNVEAWERLHDRTDPSPWLALELDQSTPLAPELKSAWTKDASTRFRQFVLPLLRPFLRIQMGVFQVYRSFVPNAFSSSKVLHRILVFCLRNFVTPEANFMLFRHFHIGSQVLEFLKDNVKGVEVKTNPLYPKSLEEFKEDLFIHHDVNLYNFIIELNIELRKKGLKLEAKSPVDFSAIRVPDTRVGDFKRGFLNVVDLESAIEIYTPVFQFFLTDREFWRSTHSLQFDETIGLYFAKMYGLEGRLVLLNNKHPMVPAITAEAGKRLLLHGVSTESLHGILWSMKNAQS